MKILVTGINGAVGGNLFRLFGKDGSFILDGMSRQPYHLLELNPDINTYNIDLIQNSPEPSFFDISICLFKLLQKAFESHLAICGIDGWTIRTFILLYSVGLSSKRKYPYQVNSVKITIDIITLDTKNPLL